MSRSKRQPDFRVMVFSREKGYVGARVPAVGERIRWGCSGWGLYREHERYSGTVVALTAKRVRVTLDTGLIGSPWADMPVEAVPVTPFTICVSPRRLSLEEFPR